jgi:hypothetical protein
MDPNQRQTYWPGGAQGNPSPPIVQGELIHAPVVMPPLYAPDQYADASSIQVVNRSLVIRMEIMCLFSFVAIINITTKII